MPNTTCPRCHGQAKPNAKGPDHVYCKRCGLVHVNDSSDDEGPYCDDPVRNAIAKEEGAHEYGRIRSSDSPQRGGLLDVPVRRRD